MCNHRIHQIRSHPYSPLQCLESATPLPRQHLYPSSGSDLSSTKTHGNILPIDQQAEAQGVLASRYYIHFGNKQNETQMSSSSSQWYLKSSTFSHDSQLLALIFQCNKAQTQSQFQVKQNTG